MNYYPPSIPSSTDDAIREEQHVLVPKLDHDMEANKKKVLDYLSIVPASFVTEMAWELTISEYMVKEALRLLMKDGLVEQIPVTYTPDVRLLARVADQSAKNMAGIENFSKKRWFGITELGKQKAAGK